MKRCCLTQSVGMKETITRDSPWQGFKQNWKSVCPKSAKGPAQMGNL